MKLTEEQKKEAHKLIDLIQYAIDDLSYFSVRKDDIFLSEVYQMEEQVKNARKQLL